jgi:putative toxin-antitoxin system antitoxin component (TIGR02293 family)
MGDHGHSKEEWKILKKYPYVESEPRIVQEAADGIYASSFFDAATLFPYKKEEFAGLLHLSLKSLIRYRESHQKLNPVQSEQVLKLISLFKKGMENFGNENAFYRWLNKPAFGLDNKKPFELMKTVSGINLILDELNQIEWGDLA